MQSRFLSCPQRRLDFGDFLKLGMKFQSKRVRKCLLSKLETLPLRGLRKIFSSPCLCTYINRQSDDAHIQTVCIANEIQSPVRHMRRQSRRVRKQRRKIRRKGKMMAHDGILKSLTLAVFFRQPEMSFYLAELTG